jgi:hypothetical protein
MKKLKVIDAFGANTMESVISVLHKKIQTFFTWRF